MGERKSGTGLEGAGSLASHCVFPGLPTVKNVFLQRAKEVGKEVFKKKKKGKLIKLFL